MLSYTLEPTKNSDLFRIVDEDGNWTHYLDKPSGRILRSVNYILDSGYPKGKGFFLWLKHATPEEAEKKLREAGEKGDTVHRLIEHFFANDGKVDRSVLIYSDEEKRDRIPTNLEWKTFLTFAHFWKLHDPTLIEYELPLYNLKQGYAGTTDALLILNKVCGVKTCDCARCIKKVGLFDWKSSGGIWDSYGPQVAAYAGAENLGDYVDRKVNFTSILRLGTAHKKTNGYELEVYDAKETKAHQKEFLAAKTMQDAWYKDFDLQKETYETPDEVNLPIKKLKK